MCDFGIISGPVAAAALAVSIAATAASTTLGVIGSIQQGKAQAASYEYQAKVAEQNEKIAKNNAAMERQTGLEEARLQRIKTLQAVGSQKTALAANGVDVSYGSSLDIIEDTAMLGELDALTIQYNAEKSARNYDTKAQNFYNDAILSRYAASNAKTSSKINAITTGINGLGEIGASVYNGLGGLSSKTVKGKITSKGLFSGGLLTDNALSGNVYIV